MPVLINNIEIPENHKLFIRLLGEKPTMISSSYGDLMIKRGRVPKVNILFNHRSTIEEISGELNNLGLGKYSLGVARVIYAENQWLENQALADNFKVINASININALMDNKYIVNDFDTLKTALSSQLNIIKNLGVPSERQKSIADIAFVSYRHLAFIKEATDKNLINLKNILESYNYTKLNNYFLQNSANNLLKVQWPKLFNLDQDMSYNEMEGLLPKKDNLAGSRYKLIYGERIKQILIANVDEDRLSELFDVLNSLDDVACRKIAELHIKNPESHNLDYWLAQLKILKQGNHDKQSLEALANLGIDPTKAEQILTRKMYDALINKLDRAKFANFTSLLQGEHAETIKQCLNENHINIDEFTQSIVDKLLENPEKKSSDIMEDIAKAVQVLFKLPADSVGKNIGIEIYTNLLSKAPLLQRYLLLVLPIKGEHPNIAKFLADNKTVILDYLNQASNQNIKNLKQLIESWILPVLEKNLETGTDLPIGSLKIILDGIFKSSLFPRELSTEICNKFIVNIPVYASFQAIHNASKGHEAISKLLKTHNKVIAEKIYNGAVTVNDIEALKTLRPTDETGNKTHIKGLLVKFGIVDNIDEAVKEIYQSIIKQKEIREAEFDAIRSRNHTTLVLNKILDGFFLDAKTRSLSHFAEIYLILKNNVNSITEKLLSEGALTDAAAEKYKNLIIELTELIDGDQVENVNNIKVVLQKLGIKDGLDVNAQSIFNDILKPSKERHAGLTKEAGVSHLAQFLSKSANETTILIYLTQNSNKTIKTLADLNKKWLLLVLEKNLLAGKDVSKDTLKTILSDAFKKVDISADLFAEVYNTFIVNHPAYKSYQAIFNETTNHKSIYALLKENAGVVAKEIFAAPEAYLGKVKELKIPAGSQERKEAINVVKTQLNVLGVPPASQEKYAELIYTENNKLEQDYWVKQLAVAIDFEINSILKPKDKYTYKTTASILKANMDSIIEKIMDELKLKKPAADVRGIYQTKIKNLIGFVQADEAGNIERIKELLKDLGLKNINAEGRSIETIAKQIYDENLAVFGKIHDDLLKEANAAPAQYPHFAKFLTDHKDAFITYLGMNADKNIKKIADLVNIWLGQVLESNLNVGRDVSKVALNNILNEISRKIDVHAGLSVEIFNNFIVNNQAYQKYLAIVAAVKDHASIKNFLKLNFKVIAQKIHENAEEVYQAILELLKKPVSNDETAEKNRVKTLLQGRLGLKGNVDDIAVAIYNENKVRKQQEQDKKDRGDQLEKLAGDTIDVILNLIELPKYLFLANFIMDHEDKIIQKIINDGSPKTAKFYQDTIGSLTKLVGDNKGENITRISRSLNALGIEDEWEEDAESIYDNILPIVLSERDKDLSKRADDLFVSLMNNVDDRSSSSLKHFFNFNKDKIINYIKAHINEDYNAVLGVLKAEHKNRETIKSALSKLIADKDEVDLYVPWIFADNVIIELQKICETTARRSLLTVIEQVKKEFKVLITKNVGYKFFDNFNILLNIVDKTTLVEVIGNFFNVIYPADSKIYDDILNENKLTKLKQLIPEDHKKLAGVLTDDLIKVKLLPLEYANSKKIIEDLKDPEKTVEQLGAFLQEKFGIADENVRKEKAKQIYGENQRLGLLVSTTNKILKDALKLLQKDGSLDQPLVNTVETALAEKTPAEIKRLAGIIDNSASTKEQITEAAKSLLGAANPSHTKVAVDTVAKNQCAAFINAPEMQAHPYLAKIFESKRLIKKLEDHLAAGGALPVSEKYKELDLLLAGSDGSSEKVRKIIADFFFRDKDALEAKHIPAAPGDEQAVIFYPPISIETTTLIKRTVGQARLNTIFGPKFVSKIPVGKLDQAATKAGALTKDNWHENLALQLKDFVQAKDLVNATNAIVGPDKVFQQEPAGGAPALTPADVSRLQGIARIQEVLGHEYVEALSQSALERLSQTYNCTEPFAGEPNLWVLDLRKFAENFANTASDEQANVLLGLADPHKLTTATIEKIRGAVRLQLIMGKELINGLRFQARFIDSFMQAAGKLKAHEWKNKLVEQLSELEQTKGEISALENLQTDARKNKREKFIKYFNFAGKKVDETVNNAKKLSKEARHAKLLCVLRDRGGMVQFASFLEKYLQPEQWSGKALNNLPNEIILLREAIATGVAAGVDLKTHVKKAVNNFLSENCIIDEAERERIKNNYIDDDMALKLLADAQAARIIVIVRQTCGDEVAGLFNTMKFRQAIIQQLQKGNYSCLTSLQEIKEQALLLRNNLATAPIPPTRDALYRTQRQVFDFGHKLLQPGDHGEVMDDVLKVIITNDNYEKIDQTAKRSAAFQGIKDPVFYEYLLNYKDADGNPLKLDSKHIFILNNALKELGPKNSWTAPTITNINAKFKALKAARKLPANFPDEIFSKENTSVNSFVKWEQRHDIVLQINKVEEPVLQQFLLNQVSLPKLTDVDIRNLNRAIAGISAIEEGEIKTITKEMYQNAIEQVFKEMPAKADETKYEKEVREDLNAVRAKNKAILLKLSENPQAFGEWKKDHYRVMQIKKAMHDQPHQNRVLGRLLVNDPTALSPKMKRDDVEALAEDDDLTDDQVEELSQTQEWIENIIENLPKETDSAAEKEFKYQQALFPDDDATEHGLDPVKHAYLRDEAYDTYRNNILVENLNVNSEQKYKRLFAMVSDKIRTDTSWRQARGKQTEQDLYKIYQEISEDKLRNFLRNQSKEDIKRAEVTVGELKKIKDLFIKNLDALKAKYKEYSSLRESLMDAYADIKRNGGFGIQKGKRLEEIAGLIEILDKRLDENSGIPNEIELYERALGGNISTTIDRMEDLIGQAKAEQLSEDEIVKMHVAGWFEPAKDEHDNLVKPLDQLLSKINVYRKDLENQGAAVVLSTKPQKVGKQILAGNDEPEQAVTKRRPAGVSEDAVQGCAEAYKDSTYLAALFSKNDPSKLSAWVFPEDTRSIFSKNKKSLSEAQYAAIERMVELSMANHKDGLPFVINVRGPKITDKIAQTFLECAYAYSYKRHKEEGKSLIQIQNQTGVDYSPREIAVHGKIYYETKLKPKYAAPSVSEISKVKARQEDAHGENSKKLKM